MLQLLERPTPVLLCSCRGWKTVCVPSDKVIECVPDHTGKRFSCSPAFLWRAGRGLSSSCHLIVYPFIFFLKLATLTLGLS